MAGESRSQTRREFPRIEVSARVRFPTLDKLVISYARDISCGGIFLRTTRLLPINAVIEVVLELPDTGGEVRAIGRVAYLRNEEEAKKKGKPPGMGIQFLDLSGDWAKRVEQFIVDRTTRDSKQPDAGVPQRELDILVVDDDPTCLDFVSSIFVTRGHKVRTAKDGLHGLAECLKAPPDVVLSDVNMPRMDGWQFLRTIRSRPSLSNVAFIFLTSLNGEKERLLGFKLGVDDYIPKPFGPEELIVRVDRVTNRCGDQRPSSPERKSLRGNLEHVSLPSLLSFLEYERKTGVLLVVNDDIVHFYFLAGRLLRVEGPEATSELQPLELALKVLSWTSGQFEFALQEVSGEDTIQTTVAGLVLEHARRTDEADAAREP